MPRPLPILRCDLATQERLFFALYEIGMRFAGCEDGDDAWRRFIGFHDMQLIWADSLDEIDGVGAGTAKQDAKWTEGRALVNSVEQFVAYMEDLRYERFKQMLDRHVAANAESS